MKLVAIVVVHEIPDGMPLEDVHSLYADQDDIGLIGRVVDVTSFLLDPVHAADRVALAAHVLNADAEEFERVGGFVVERSKAAAASTQKGDADGGN